MSAIAEFKKQYPAYAGVPDEELASALHAKFYSSMPREAFMERVGLADASILERVSDFGLDASKGVVGLGESVVGVADLLTGNRVGNALRDTIGYDPKRTKDIIAEGYSAERRRENAAVQDADGFIGTVEALIDNPAVALGSIGESAPMMLGSAAAVRAAAVRMLGAAGIAPGTQAAAAYLRQPGVVAKLATIGSATEGATAAGSIQSEARQEGREWADSAPYAVAGGVGTAVIGKAASRLLPDVDVGLGVAGLGAGGRTSALEAAKQIGRGTIQEGILEELPQSAQEQVAQNLAMGKPWDEGVPEAAAQGMVAGLGMGAGGSGARVALDSYTAATTDATRGMEFDQAAIEAAARAQLDPDMAQMELRRRADAAQADISNAQSISSAVDAFANATSATSDDLNLGTLQTEAIIGQREAAAIDQADLLRRAQLAAGIEQEADPLALPTMPEFSAGMGYGQPLDLRLPEREQPIQPDRAPIMPDFTAGAGFGQQTEVMPLDQAPVTLPIESYTPEPQPEPFPVAPGTPMPEPRPPADVPYADATIEQARAAIQADPMRPKTAQLEGEGIIGTFTSKTAAAVAARIVRKTLPDTQLDVVQQGERWALVPQQVAPTTAPSAPTAAPTAPEADSRFEVVLPTGRTFGTYTDPRDAEGALKRAGAGATVRRVPIGTPAAPPAWQMTPDEFIDSDKVRRVTTARADLQRQHFEAVRGAVERGEPVPDRVLANYSALVRPDLNDDQRDLMLDQVRGTAPEAIVSGWRSWGRSTPDIPTSTATPEAAPAQAPQQDTEQDTDTPLLQASGRPFKNAKLAATSAKQRGFDMRPVRVDGGWGLVPTEQAPLPQPWELNQDDFTAFAQIEREGKGWVARWNGEVLKNEAQVVNGNLGRTLVQGARVFPTKKEAELAARRAHRTMVDRAIERGEQVAPEIVALYPELNAQAGTTPAAAPQRETETPDATPSTPTTAPAFAPGQTAKGRDVLLAQVEQLKTRTAPADLVKDYNQLKDRIADARRRASLKGTKRAEATKLTEWADNQDRELERLRNAIGFVELKAGTSRFKVLNTPGNLDAFARRLKAAPIGRWSITVQPDEIYDNVETRPGTTEKQRETGRSAVRELARRVTAHLQRRGNHQDRAAIEVLGSRLFDGFAFDGGVDLVGQRVASAEDLATLAQVFRDPRYETFRVFYTDAQGVVVGEGAYSSRLPAAVNLPNDFDAHIRRDMGRFGASGFFVLHNHPSGRATPSPADVNLTKWIASSVNGFRGHVVIDHNEFATIDAGGAVQVVQAPKLNGTDFGSKPELDHHMLGSTINGEQDVVQAAKALQVKNDHAALIFLRRDQKVQLVMDVPMALLQDTSRAALGKLRAVVRAFARESGAGGWRFLVLPDGVSPEPLKRLVLDNIFTDIVSADGTTAGNFGAVSTGDFLDQNMPVRQVKDEAEERTARAPATPYQAGQPQPNRTQQTPSTPPAETRARAFQRRTQDKFNRFTVIQDWLKDRGIDLTEQADVYRAEERMHGRAATRIEDFREKRMKPIVEKIRAAGFSMAEVADFLHAQHAEERNEQIARLNSEMPDGGSGMTTADARAKLAQYRTQPELVRLANELQAITQDTKRILLEAGIITQEMAAAWDATYQHYVPLKGGPEEDAANQGTGRGLTVKQKNKRALGHGTREEWTTEHILRDHERAILQAEKNRVGQHLLALAIEAGHEDLITIGKPAKRQVLKDSVHYEVRLKGSTIEVFRNLADAQRFVGQQSAQPGRSRRDFSIATSHDLDVVMMPSPVLEPNETQVYVDGHAVRIQFKDDGLARAWNNLGAESFNVVMRMAREVNTFLSRAYTSGNPEFIITNLIRDLGTGVLNLTGEEGGRFALSALKNYPRAFAELLKYAHTGNASNWIAQYRADGGTTGAAYLSDLERIGKDVQGAYDEAAGVIQTWRNGGSYRAARAAVREVLGPFVRWIEKLNQAGENAMRLAAYRTAVEMGQSRARAAALAKNATVNFNRNGELGQTIGSLYLFANPAIQGTASIAHALFKGKHRAQAQALTSAIVAAGYTMAALNGGGPEDEYEKLPEFQKERFMPIWTGDGWVKIPIPYGYGFFATMGRQLAALEKGEDPAKVSLRLASAFVEEFSVWGAAADPEGDEKNVTFLLPTIPQIVMAPIINKTGLGAPVYPESPFDQSKPDNLKMWRTTQGTVFHDTAKGLNALTGGDAVQKGWADISPETLRYLWTTATGGTGRFFTDTAALAKNLTVEGLEPRDIESREVPIVRKFIGPANDIRGARARFWEAAEEVREAQEAFARAKKLEDLADRNDLTRQIQAENRELLAMGKALDARTKAIKHERDLIDAIMADESRTLSERRVMVREVEARERRLYDQFVAEFKERTK